MIAKRYGKIINIGSIVSHAGLGSKDPYAASKGTVRQLTRSLFRGAGHRRRIMAKQPKLGLPDEDDIACAVLPLASDAARYINGEFIYVDGAPVLGWVGPE